MRLFAGLVLLSLIGCQRAACRSEASTDQPVSKPAIPGSESAADADSEAIGGGTTKQPDDPVTGAPGGSQGAVYDVFKVRDPAPACIDAYVKANDVVNTLMWVIDNAKQPPWVAIRAATCLIHDHGVWIQDEMIDWVTNPEKAGLGILTLNEIDTLPEEVALAVAKAALGGPDPAGARTRLEKSESESIQALLTEASPN